MMAIIIVYQLERQVVVKQIKPTTTPILVVKTRVGFSKDKVWYNLVYSQFAKIYYVTAYKTIHIYYLKKSHKSLNRSCD